MFSEAISKLLRTQVSKLVNYNYKPNVARLPQLTQESDRTQLVEVVGAEDYKVTLTSK